MPVAIRHRLVPTLKPVQRIARRTLVSPRPAKPRSFPGLPQALPKRLARRRSTTVRRLTRAVLDGLRPDVAPGNWIDEGGIGRPVTGTAFMLGRGMEQWHPNPSFYCQAGAGPLFDMGPYSLTMLVNLLGPVGRVFALAGIGQAERSITANGPLRGTTFAVDTPTTVLSLLEFTAGAIVIFGMSWDVYRRSNHPLEIQGTEGSLRLPAPDTFGARCPCPPAVSPGCTRAVRNRAFGTHNRPREAPDRASYRMLAVAEMAASLRDGVEHRATGQLALHVPDVMASIATAAERDEALTFESTVDRPRSAKRSPPPSGGVRRRRTQDRPA